MTDRNSPPASTSSYRRGSRISRRAALSFGGTGLLAAMAGCSSITGTSSNGPTSGSNGVFQDISFDGQQMVVELAEDHGVKKLNLIGPDGQEFTSKTVSTGSTRVDIQMLDIAPETGSYSHYSRGTYELHAITESDNQTETLELKPEIKISGIEPFEDPRSGGIPNAKVSVRNIGSAPTWVYDVAFKEAPNSEASEVGSNPGTPEIYLKRPKDAVDTILNPGEVGEFVASQQPFLLKDRESCTSGTHSGEVVVITGDKKTTEKGIRAEFSGGLADKESAANWERYICGDASIELQEPTSQTSNE